MSANPSDDDRFPDGAPQAPGLDSAMQTGSEAGSPGERADVAPEDLVARVVADDDPLPPGTPGVGPGGPQDDGLAPSFSPPAAEGSG